MNRTALVTGATGFVGSNLVSKLLSEGYKVVALIRKKQHCPLFHDYLTIIEGNILDKKCLLGGLREVDVLFHCAAFISFNPRDSGKSHEVNVIGTKNVLEAALHNGVKKVVHLSAASVLGYTRSPKEIIDERTEFHVSRRSSYTYTKRLAEDVVIDYVSKGLDASIANIATVYGSGDRKMNSGSIIRSIYRNQVKFAPPGGTSYVSVSDLVRGLIILSERGESGEHYIFCTQNLPFLELFNRIAKTLRRNTIRSILPHWTFLPVWGTFGLRDLFLKGSSNKLNVLTARIIKESYFYKYYSSKKARQELGWQPKVFLEEAVRAALDFYLKEGLM